MTPEILDNLPYIAGGLFVVGGALAAVLWRGGSSGSARSATALRKTAEREPHTAKEDSRGVPGLAILGVVPAVDEGQPLLLHRLPLNAPLAEAYRQVWAQVGVTAKESGESDEVIPRVFAVAGLDGHSGASTTTANLATAAARLGYRVLVVDADLARPSQQGLLGTYADPNSAGLAEMLASGNFGDAADVAQPTLAEGVRLIPAGDVESGQSDLFGLIPSQPSQRFIRSVAPALGEIVLLDCPPILSGEPGMEAMCEVEDGVLVVVGADGFDKARLAQAVKWLEESGGELRGAILVPPIHDETEADSAAETETLTAEADRAVMTPRTSSEIIAAAIAESETEEVPDTYGEDEEAEEMMSDKQPEPLTARVGESVEEDEEEEEPVRPLFLSEATHPPVADTARRRPAAVHGSSVSSSTRRVTDSIPEGESAGVFESTAGSSSPGSAAPIPPTAFSVPTVAAVDTFPAAVTVTPVAPPGEVWNTTEEQTPVLEEAAVPEVAEEESPQEEPLEEAGFTTEEITANGEAVAAAEAAAAAQASPEEARRAAQAEEADDEEAEGEEIIAPDAPRLSVSLDDIAFAESFAEAFANAPESTFDISEGETVTLVPTTDAQTLTPPPSPPLPPAAFVPAMPANPLPVAAPAVSLTAASPRRTEMMMEMVAGAEDATTLRATTAASAAAQKTPRVTLEITTKRGESLGMRAGTPNTSEDGQLPPDVLLETTTREEAPDAATMRLLVSDTSGDEAGEGTVLEASLQKPEAIMIRSGAGQTGEVGVRFEVNSDKSGGTRFRATVAHRDEPATYLVEMERTLVEEPLPSGTADVPKKQWRNRVSLRTVEKE